MTHERGPLLQHFQVDPATERSLAWLRAGAAGIAGLSALALLMASLPFVILLVAVLALCVSVGWLAKATRLGARARAPADHFLTLYRHGFEVGEGAKRTWVHWDSVTQVDVDEERLDIVVELSNEEPLRLEPRYPGVAIHELMHTLQSAWRDRSGLSR